MAEFTMPSLGADMEDGTLIEWLVAPGAVVKRGDIVAVVETQKGAIEIETFQAGEVTEILVAEGDKVPVGTVLARIGEATPVAAPLAPAPPAPVPPAPPVPTPPAPPAVQAPLPSTRSPDRVRSSPAARRRAYELGVDVAAVVGTGPHGAVTRADVEAARARPAPAPPPDPPKAAASGMRQAIAAAMERSNREIPHYYLSHHVDLRAALDHLGRLNQGRSVEARLLPAVLTLRATALALAKHPELNGTWEEGAFRPGQGVHLGVAIHLRAGGLVIPAIRDADRKDLDQLMADLTDVVARARAGRLRAGELSCGTATLTSLGDRGVEGVFGIVYPPQVALIGAGAILERPWAVDGMLTVRPVMQLTLAADHRASDGHAGSRFLDTLATLLGKPEKL